MNANDKVFFIILDEGITRRRIISTGHKTANNKGLFAEHNRTLTYLAKIKAVKI